ncbi:MAG TPA: cation diffusion facilitator family transporter [Gammaproteobacteria bacterium]|nr:cation diffusion facilitator family transporter [Gammaproteobacteria bacterium]
MAEATGSRESILTERYRDTRRVTLVGAALNLVLAAGKVAVGIVAHSQALVADGIHSFSDLLSDGLVVFAARHAHRAADQDHPYGHGRFETIATVALGIFLAGVGIGIAVDAVNRLFHPGELVRPGYAALVVAALSVAAKEWLYHYTVRVARRLRSTMLRANAWHHRSDAISSIVVIVGIAGTIAGLPYLDSVAAIVVAFMIARIGWDLGWKSTRELVDTALDEGRVREIRDEIRLVKGVRSVHDLRTRHMGSDALVDVHVQVDPRLSVSEGHLISELVHQRLVRRVPEVTDVLVHIDPEDDEVRHPSVHLPLRAELMDDMRRRWREIPGAGRIEDVTLHYLDGRIRMEVVLPLDAVPDTGQARALARRIRTAALDHPDVADVDVRYH